MGELRRWPVLSLYVRVFQWIGFQPYCLDKVKIKPFLLSTVLHCSLVVTNLVLVIRNNRRILYNCESIGRVVDCIKLATIILVYFIIYIELFRTSQMVSAFWKKIYEVHRVLKTKQMVDHRALRLICRYYWIFIVASFVQIAASDGIYYFTSKAGQTKLFIKYFFWLQYLVSLKEYQLLYPSIILHFYLRSTNAWLQHHIQLFDSSERLNNARYTQFIVGRLQSLKLIHGELYRATELLNLSFGRTNMAIYCKNYLLILSNSYWVVFWIMNGQMQHAFKIGTQLLVRIMFLAALYYVDNKAMLESKIFVNYLHNIDLRLQLRERFNFVMIESFMRQTSLERIKITAVDCITMNYTPLLAIIFSTCTYIAIFIQKAPTGDRILLCYHNTS
ncbi:uncharacterized protein LOC118459315 [Anopheles albimanus]|uniref:Gustatory receptor n=1 Tax=Anopheles albimanus TaxID=7167 RepID=A0A182FZL6_ANOAL|nr:uncharacterized protein LOC118459315 [Anopheles albimanus]